MRRWILSTIMCLIVAGLALNPGSAPAADVVKWGVLIDQSGPTSDWGKTQLRGQLDAMRWINENGGINGKNLELIPIDDAYNVQKGVAGYNRLIESEKVLGLYIQSTPLTLNLAQKIVEDKIVTLAASYAAAFQDPSKYPYSFYVSPSYATMARIVLKWVKENWKDTSRKPKMCFLYPDNQYGKHIMEVCKEYAQEIGVELVPDQVINWPTKDATVQLTNMNRTVPDFAYITSTAMNGAVILKNARDLQLKTKFISNIRNFEETLVGLSEGAAEGSYGVNPFAPYAADVPGMKKIVDCFAKWHPGDAGTNVYVEGWVNILVAAEGLRKADKAGKLTPQGVKDALEEFRNFDTGGLAPPLTYTKDDHQGSMAAKVFQVKNGKFVDVSGWIDLPRDKKYFGR